jgi:hypothetical protein
MSWATLHTSVDTAYGEVRRVLPDVERIEVVQALELYAGPVMRRSLAVSILTLRLDRLEEAERRAEAGPTAEELEVADWLRAHDLEPKDP